MNDNSILEQKRKYWLNRFNGNFGRDDNGSLRYEKRDFISLTDYSGEELEALLTFAEKIKSGKSKKKYISGKTVGLMFGVASTRTRISFNVGVKQLGGHSDYYNTKDLQLINNESLVDTIRVMNRYIEALMVRMYDMNHYGKGHEAMELLAREGTIPIINGLDDKEHPCQVMADILTIKEKFGDDYKKKKVVFTWGFAKRQKSPGVPHSMMVAASLLGMNILFAHPRDFELDNQYVDWAQNAVKHSGGKLEFCNDLMEASKGADVIYVKSWKSLRLTSEEDEKIRYRIRKDWCITEEHFKQANPDAIFMNCLPIIRGEQAMAEVIDGPHSVILDEAENRLHIQKAIMAALIR